jgi:hypothetical protein
MPEPLLNALKLVARVAALILVCPAILSYRLGGIVLGADRALQGTTQALALLPGISGQYLRNAFLRHALAYCHPTVVVEFGTLFSKVGARLEENVYIGPMCHIGLAQIGRDALLAPGVQVPSGPRIRDHSVA